MPFAAALARLGEVVVGTTTRSSRIQEIEETGAEACLLRFDDPEALVALLKGRKRVFFCAAPARGASYQSLYLDGMKAVLAAVDWTSTELIAFTSSTRVYPQDDGSKVDESSEAEPEEGGGRVLRSTEKLLLDRAASQGVRGLVLRVAGIWGPGRNPVNWLKRSEGRLRGWGSAYLNLAHRDDIVAALVASTQSDIEGVLNVAGPAAVIRREFFGRLAAEHGLPKPHFAEGDSERPRGKQVHASRVEELLGRSLRPAP